MLVDVERDERGRVPDWERVLGVADVVEEAAFVPVVGGPGPASPGHAARLEVAGPVFDGAEVTLDQPPDQPARSAPVAPEMLEINLVVLDPADRKRELDLERAELGIDLVGRAQIDGAELLQDLVSLVHVSLVELVVRLDALARDAVELEQLGLQLPGGDLLMVEGERCHVGSFRSGRASIPSPPTSLAMSGPKERRAPPGAPPNPACRTGSVTHEAHHPHHGAPTR